MNEGRPALRQFLRAYLHEDWDIVHGDVWRALDSYLRSSDDAGRLIAAEIARLLEDLDDAGLEEFLRSHHCAYSTHRDPGGDRGWLLQVARRAELGPDDSLLPPPFTDVRSGRYSSSFPDQDTAEDVMAEVIYAHEAEIRRWLESDQQRLMLEGTLDRPTGRAGNYARGIEEVTGVRIVLVQDREMPDGFRVHTGYPQHARTPRTDLPALSHLTGAYFHQDWDEELTYPDLVEAFVHESPDLAPLLPDELAQLRSLPEDQIDALLEQLGCEFSLVRDETWHAWLDDLDRRVRAVDAASHTD